VSAVTLLLRALVIAAALLVVSVDRGDACGGWVGPGAYAFPPPCAAPPVYYAYPPVFGYYPYPYPYPAPLAYAPYVRGPEYWYYRSLRRDDFYDRPRIHGYTLR
jgi:hypothetical protein